MKILAVVLVLRLPLIVFAKARIFNGNSSLYTAEEEYRLNQSSLLKSILDKCDPLIVPIQNSSSRLQLEMRFGLISIIGLDAQEQTLQTLSFLIVAWHDNLLTWNSDGDINDEFYIPNKLIWVPPLLIANAVEGTLSDSMVNGFSRIHNHSMIISTPFIRSKTSCRVDISKFPFDTQVCEIRIGSTNNKVEVNAVPHVDLMLFEPSNEWELLKQTFTSIPLYGQDLRGSMLTVVLRRRWFFYLIKSIIPSYALSLINAFVFLLPAQSGERMTMSISSFLSYAIYVTYIHESLPTNSDTNCYFLVYLCAMMVVCVGIILVSVFSLRLHQKATEGEVPYWLRRVFGGKNTIAVEKNEKSSIVPSKAMSIEISKRFDKCCFIAFFTSNVVTTVTLTVLYTT